MIHELLGTGEKEAITAAALAKNLNMDTRNVMDQIRTERLSGILICSSHCGYFMPGNDLEINHTISRLYRFARENIKVAKAMQEAMNKRAAVEDIGEKGQK